MMQETIDRANEILKNKEVKIINDSKKNYYHFQVKQRSGEWADIWYKPVRGKMEWMCNALDKSKKWGCMLGKKDRTKPYCSHSLACVLFLQSKGVEL